MTINVIFTSTSQMFGYYQGSLIFYSNDPVNPVITVPCNLDVWVDQITNTQEYYLLMYPNPARDYLNITTNSTLRNVRIVSQAGQLVFDKVTDGQTLMVNTSDLMKDIYIVEIITDAGVSTQKLIIR